MPDKINLTVLPNFSLKAKLRYPKLLLFLCSVIIVYFLFSGILYIPLYDALQLLGYLGTFIAGLLYPYSFTSAAGTAILLILGKEQNIIAAGAVASIGALVSDLAIFFFVRISFSDEIRRLSKEKAIQTIGKRIPESARTYLLSGLASILIASPLPTEIGIMLLSSVRKITTKRFAALVYILHVSAIFVILLIGSRI